MSVATSQRYTRLRPCPICGGYDQAVRGRAIRCAGFASTDGEWARCTREEHAGNAELDERCEPPAYVHRRHGRCKCGREHGPEIPAAAAVVQRPAQRNGRLPEGREVAAYAYVDLDGSLLYQNVRFAPKDFRPRRPDGRGGWIWNRGGIAPVVRHLPQLYAAETGQVIYYTEGEKDQECLAGLGWLATTAGSSTMVAKVSNWGWVQGHPFVILVDNDEDGEKAAKAAAEKAEAAGAASIRVVRFPELDEGGDVSDFLELYSEEDLMRRIERAEVLPPPEAEPPPEASLPWTTAAKLATETPAEIEWAWCDYLALGTVVELDAKMKAGKSTFIGHLLHALLEGRPFLGRPTLSGPVVYLTEEGDRTFRALVARTGLAERDDLHILSRRKVPQLEWEQLVDAARLKLVDTGAVVLVVDTLAKVAGLKDDDENSSGRAMAAMAPLQALATQLGIVVVVVRHDRKAGGEVGDSARGSSAFGGDADVIIQLSRVGGKGRESQRCLRSIGRFDETPPELIVDLTATGYQEVTGTDARDEAAKALLGILPTEEGDAVAVVDLLPELKEHGHNRSQVYAAVDFLLSEGLVVQDKRKGPSGRMRLVIWQRSSNGGT